jgi:thiol:disulfide interchange protein DsbC
MKSNVLKVIAGTALCGFMLVACKDNADAANAQPTLEKAPTAGQQPAAASAGSGDVTQTITNALKRAQPRMEVFEVTPSQIGGLYKARVSGGVIYVTGDGAHFIAGELYQVTDTQFLNLTEQERAGERKALLAEVPMDQTINFSPKETKGTAFVFTDVDCFYCQKLHHGMAKMNELGIEIRYLAYPRAGIGSPSYQKVASAWCAENKQEAMNKLKNREEIPMNVCANNPVAGQYALGDKMGVNGTPAIFLADGTMIPGYLPPEELAKRLGIAAQ